MFFFNYPERVARPTDKLLECREAAIDCLEYLDSRTEFWRQQKPMYSRKRDKALRDGVSSRASSTGGQNSKKWITKQLEAIDNGMNMCYIIINNYIYTLSG